MFFVLGLLSKENAILLPLYLAVIEWCLWRQDAQRRRTTRRRRAATWFFAVTLLAPLLVGLALFAWQPGLLLDGYASRPFTLGERLLTEARVLWFYVGLVLLPTPARLGLYHDDIATSTGLLEPWTTLLALDGWLVVLMAALLLRRRAPAFTFGVLWFLAGHALESTVVPLEIAHEHRNYLPSFGLLFAAVYGVARFARHTGNRRVYAALGLAAALALGFGTFGRAASWHSDETIIEALYRHHPAVGFGAADDGRAHAQALRPAGAGGGALPARLRSWRRGRPATRSGPPGRITPPASRCRRWSSGT